MRVTRREFISGIVAAGSLANAARGDAPAGKIDRYALVSRHNPVITKFDPLSPLSVGNGEFAFTCDPTGLQTFPELYAESMPLCTMSQWGWHTSPLPEHLVGKELKLTEYDTYGRKVGYQTGKTGQEELYDWLRENPHRLHLGQIGFIFTKADGSEADSSDVAVVEQKLDLWTGIIRTRFLFEGQEVKVITAVHPTRDMLAVSVNSVHLRKQDKLSIRFKFPYGSSSIQAADWKSVDKHSTKSGSMSDPDRAYVKRTVDSDKYFMQVRWSGAARAFVSRGSHDRAIVSAGGETMDFTAAFRKSFLEEPILTSTEVFEACERHWKNFWTIGAAVDLSASTDKRAPEIERRIVLSQYLTAIQCSGSTPPQETGLTCNSWYGKFHIEMHWWHAAHFALWGRFPMLEKSLGWYEKILPSAKARAKQQGYEGARWPKMTSPDGRDSPSPIGPLLIWQQPHPIFYAELAYLVNPSKSTLNRYREIVDQTASFMASYAHYDAATNRYVLGPPVIPAQENHPPRETWNPTFDLEYWHFGLTTSQKWRERLGQKRDEKWDDIIAKLANLPVIDGDGRVSSQLVSKSPTDGKSVYAAHENCPQTFTERNKDHPSMLAAFGMLTGQKVDRETMSRTLKKVMAEWDWPETWGWDYPMVAMTAARLGETETAIDALLLDTPKNRYLPNGHNYQRPNLPCYLPGNGGLLYAVAMMANGWKGGPKTKSPGFPAGWKVKAEGFDAKLFKEI